MPDNILHHLKSINPIILGVIMSMLTAGCRVGSDEKETSFLKVLLESLLCGCLTLTAGGAVLALNVSVYWVLFIGGVIGGVGSRAIRVLAIAILSRKGGKL